MKYLKKTIAIILYGVMLSSCIAQNTQTDIDANGKEQTATTNMTNETTQPTETAIDATELTINAYLQQELLETIALMFMDSHPGVTVTVNNFFENRKTIVNAETGAVEGFAVSDDTSLANYRQYINTLLMSGNADDIIIFQDIPEYQYERMGALADLTPYIVRDASINEDTFFMNVLDAAKDADGRMYKLPVTATVNTPYYFDKALTENTGIAWDVNKKMVTYAEMFAYAKQICVASTLEETYLDLGGRSPAYFGINWAAALISDRCYPEFVDLANRAVHFNNPAFIELLTSVYETMQTAALVPEDRILDNDYYIPFRQSGNVKQGAGLFVMNPDKYYNMMPTCNAQGEIGSSPMRAAITANSPNKDLAWEFLRFMLTDEVQTLPSLYALCVSRTALPIFTENYCASWKTTSDGALDFQPDKLHEVWSDWLSMINALNTWDFFIDDTIYTELQLYFTDAQTAEETARNLQHTCDLYLNQ